MTCYHGHADDRPCDRCAPTPRDTGQALDPRAVKAAAEALRADCIDCERGEHSPDTHAGDAAVAVAAAAPILLAAERQRIATAIRANHRRAYHLDSTAGPLCICGRLDPCPDAALAARIAEGEA